MAGAYAMPQAGMAQAGFYQAQPGTMPQGGQYYYVCAGSSEGGMRVCVCLCLCVCVCVCVVGAPYLTAMRLQAQQ